MLSCDIRKVMAAALVLTTTFITMPVSAADFSAARPVIGSVSAVGSVELRGVGISQEGTLFSGDSIRSHEKGYAKVLLGTGSKVELYEKTDVSVVSDAQGVKIAMNTGNLGFTAAKSSLRVDVAPFEVIASDNAAGNIAVISPTTAGVRAINGKVTVKNLKTSETFVLTKGQEQLLGLPNGVHSAPLAQIASNVPQPIPAPGTPQTPAGQTKSNPGLAMDTGAWLAVAGAAGLAAVSIWALVEAHNNNNDINSLKTQVGTLNGTITTLNGTIASNQAANAAAIHATQQTANLALAASQESAASSQQALLAAQAQLALQAAGNTSGAAQAATLSGQIASNQAALNALAAAIQANQGNAAAVANLTAQEEALRLQTNNLSLSLSSLLNSFKGTPGVPVSGNVPGPVGQPNTSASVPA